MMRLGRFERSATPRALLGRLGRVVLWLALTVTLVRGLADVVATERRTTDARVVRAVPLWPDDAARAFAIEFAGAYLTVEPDADPRAALEELAAPELASSLAPTLDGEPARQRVVSATIADATRVDGDRALVTVAARVRGEQMRIVRLAVPVARDAHGGLVVYDLPSLAPIPRRADAGPVSGASLIGDERVAIGDVLTRFLRAYLGGDRAGLVYLVPPGTRVGATAGGFELLQLGSLSVVGATAGRERLVLTSAHVRDRASRVTFALRYRVRLVRRDRWYVAAVNEPGRG